MSLRIDRISPGEAAMARFASVRHPASGPGSEEAVPDGVECLLASVGGAPVARLGVLVAPGLNGAPGPSGLIGWYEALDGEAGTALLCHAREVLADRGVARVLGPMNGSTWARYRLALPPEAGEPSPAPFLGEPVNPPEYPEHFTAAGFSVEAEYESRVVPRPEGEVPDGVGTAARLAEGGVEVRAPDPERFEEQLREIFELSLRAFSGNLYYTPIGYAPFRAAYERIRPLLDPELVRLAYGDGGALLGYVFAYPDPLDRAPGRPPRVVLKTLATAPEARGLGLGSHLTSEVARIAFARGAPAVIHALMHVDNTSTRISGKHAAALFRGYALYGWTP